MTVLTSRQRTHLQRHVGITRYIVKASNGSTMYPDKTLQTIHRHRALKRRRELERAGFAVKFITVHPR